MWWYGARWKPPGDYALPEGTNILHWQLPSSRPFLSLRMK
jgi:hypothetical protein